MVRSVVPSMLFATQSGLEADLRARESQWLLAGVGLVALFAVCGVLAFSIAKNGFEQVVSILAGFIGLGFFFLFRWSSRRQSGQIMQFTEQLGEELLEARFTSEAGFVLIFRNGVYFQWFYGSRANSFIGYRAVFAAGGDPIVPGIKDVGRYTSSFFWGRELLRVSAHAGPEPIRSHLQVVAKSLGYVSASISVQVPRTRESSTPDQAEWFVGCGLIGGRFWKNGPRIASGLEALRQLLDEARTAAIAVRR